MTFRKMFIVISVLIFVAGCRHRSRAPQSLSSSRTKRGPQAVVLAEASRLGIQESPAFKEKLQRVSDDLLAEELFQQWAAEDEQPANLVKCYQEHKQDFAKHYRRVYGLVDPKAKNADAIVQWRQKLQKGEDFRELAAKGCEAGEALCGVHGDLGYLDTSTWFQKNGLQSCAHVVLKDQDLYGPCGTSPGFGYFMLTDERVIIPTLEEIGNSLRDKCVTIGRSSRITRLNNYEVDSGIRTKK